MLQRMNVHKEEIKVLKNENSSLSKATAVEDTEVIRAENEALKRSLGSEEHMFLSPQLLLLLRVWMLTPKCSMIPFWIKN